MQDALHSIQSLLCMATNVTPHESLFAYSCHSTSGCSIPTWLTAGELVLLRKHVRHSKYDPLVDEVELLEVNPQFAHVRFPDGKEATVSVRDLAPRGQSPREDSTDDDGTSGFRCPHTGPGPDSAATEQIKADDVPCSIDSHGETLAGEAPSGECSLCPSIRT